MPSRAAILSTISSVNNYWTQNNSAGSINNTWDGAVYMIGDMDAYAATGNSNYLNYAKAWASAYNYALISGNSTRDANYQAAGEVYVRLYQLTGTASDLTNITADVKSIVNGSSSKDWTWVDALNMAMPVFAELGQINNSSTYSAKMFSEYNYTKTSLGGPGLYNTTEHLWSRDATFLGTNIYWSRGNAWAFVALAKVLETLPTSDSHYSDYLGTFQAMAAKLITLQQSDGFWYANLLNPSQYPTPETSGTSGFTYGLAWGINAGALDSATYLPAVTKAWNGMVATAVHSNGFLGYVQGSGTQPSSSQPTTYNSTADFGVGLFLEAGNQVAKLASASGTPVAAPTFNPSGGNFSSPQTVTISTTTSGASIRYTTDGSTPSETAGTIYSGPVSIGSTTTLKALAYESGFTDSTVTSETYTISTGGGTVATPTFSPAGGTYSSAQTVTLSDSTSGATIYYTTNGTTPTTSSTVYSGAISVSSGTVAIEALGVLSGDTNSSIASATYTISTVEGPFGGTAAAIPGTVQAENYDTGGQGVAYNVTSINGTDNGYRSDGVDLEVTSDTGGGVDLGWTSPGQWFKYTVNVATAGTYTVSFRVAAPGAVTDAFHLSNAAGTNLSGNVNLPATGGYQTWATVTASVTLPAGQQTLTLNQDNGSGVWNINYASFATSGGGTVATPTFSPAGGTYSSAQSVTLSDSTGGATIYYTTDGSTPTTSSTVYSSAIAVNSGTVTIKAMAALSGDTNSSVASATYTISTVATVATPTFSPAGGTYSTAQTVSISDSTGGATIHYTTDGSTPTASSTVYSSPIAVSSGTVTIQAIGILSGDNNSAVGSATYTISTGGGGCQTATSSWTSVAATSVTG
ncbi:MAG TPA: chitobiase/beta-hexosaminidase C-terminal domain-containing protein, partial [Opitutaceae bacterium]|nr:chitobiase/beta-hexosaminidase C-terminal domain-containing protein [Opitutaceae bacterium]